MGQCSAVFGFRRNKKLTQAQLQKLLNEKNAKRDGDVYDNNNYYPRGPESDAESSIDSDDQRLIERDLRPHAVQRVQRSHQKEDLLMILRENLQRQQIQSSIGKH